MVIFRRVQFFVVAAAALVLILGAAAVVAHLWARHHFDEANRLVEQQQFAQAYDHYVQCLAVWRRSADTHLLAGRTARRALKYPEAELHFDRCMKLRGSDRATATAVALERLLVPAQQGEFTDVEEILWEKVKREAPETPLILEAMARGYMRMFRLGAALRCLRMIVERDPDNVEALANRGFAFEHTGALTDAMKDYRRVLELNAERDDVRLRMAAILVKDSPDEARGEFERLYQRQPDNFEVLLGLAHAYQALGPEMADKAIPLIDAVLEKDPNNSKALAERGFAVGMDRPAEGEALLRRAIASDPSNYEAQYQLYLCLQQQPGRGAEADAQREVYKGVEADKVRLAQIVGEEMTKAPYDPNLHCEIGKIYLKYGKVDLGLRWLQKALRLDKNHQPTLRALDEYAKKTKGQPKAEQSSGN